MKLEIEIEYITVVIRPNRVDTVYLHTKSLPTAYPKLYPSSNPALKLDVEHGYGEEYCKVNFPDIKRIDVMDGRKIGLR